MLFLKWLLSENVKICLEFFETLLDCQTDLSVVIWLLSLLISEFRDIQCTKVQPDHYQVLSVSKDAVYLVGGIILFRVNRHSLTMFLKFLLSAFILLFIVMWNTYNIIGEDIQKRSLTTSTFIFLSDYILSSSLIICCIDPFHYWHFHISRKLFC